MKKTIKLTESELIRIIKRVISEQPEEKFDTPYNKNLLRSAPKINVSKKTPMANPDIPKDINPKKLKIGDGGSKTPNLRKDVIELQNKLISLGCLRTKTGKGTGYFGSMTKSALDLYNKQGYCKTKKLKSIDKTISKKNEPKVTVDNKVSQQVKNQLEYMSKNGILKNEKFTIVDDKNNLVLAYEPNYTLYKIYNVITGKDIGDELKTETMGDFYRKNFVKNTSNLAKSIMMDLAIGKTSHDYSFKFLDKFAKELDSCYFNQKEWLVKNTPSGVFKRAPTVENFMNDLLATQFMEKDYGKRFITWETLDGDTIPFGFHGTKNPSRVPILDSPNLKNLNCKKRNMSFGCINFKEEDIIDINKFINAGQLSIWLPDATNDIVEVNKPGSFSSFFS